MTYSIAARWHIPGTRYESQRIDGDDGSVWIRLSRDGELVAVFSAAREGPGVMPVQRVAEVLAEATTARRPEVLINALRFPGWEFWPAVPVPLADYLDHRFREDVGRVRVTEPSGR
jgi:hypothetical protein